MAIRSGHNFFFACKIQLYVLLRSPKRTLNMQLYVTFGEFKDLVKELLLGLKVYLGFL